MKLDPWSSVPRSSALFALIALGCAPVAVSGEELDLGSFDGKMDRVEVRVAFEVDPGETIYFAVGTVGRLHVTTAQEGTAERLQLVAESSLYRRRSWRGRSPFLRIPGTATGGTLTEYALRLHNWGASPARGYLGVAVDAPDEPGVRFVANQPDCADCERPEGELRDVIIDAIQRATRSIDFAVYGVDDPAVVESLCHAAEAGVRVRVVTDAEETTFGERYYPAIESFWECGIPVERTATGAIMHNKYFVIDAGTENATLITGSTNQTRAGFEFNHNHMVVIHGASALVEAYATEFQQLFEHCLRSTCGECTPACTLDATPAGPYAAGDVPIEARFSPTDGVLEELRGASSVELRDEPDPECGLGRDCLCVPSGARWRCDYCGLDGWGRVGEVENRALIDVYSFTDACLGLALGHAERRGVETLVIYDRVKAGSPWSQDENTCAMGVPTLYSWWRGGSAQARNHHKLLVLDDTVVTGSMNLSASGNRRNHENTLFIEDPAVADEVVGFIESEAEDLRALGMTSRCPRATPYP